MSDDELFALAAQIDWDRVMLDSWGDGWPWPVGPILDWLESAVGSIEGWINDNVWNPIRERFEWVANWIRDAVNNLTDWIRNFVWWGLNWLNDTVGPVIRGVAEAVNNFVAGMINWLRDRLIDVWNWLRDHVTAIGTWLHDHVLVVWGWISAHVSAVGSWLWDRLVDVWNWVRDHVTAIGTWLHDHVLVVWGWISAAIDRSIAGYTAAFQWLGGLIAETWATATGFIQHEVIDPLGDWLARIGDSINNIWTQLLQIPGRVWSWLGQAMSNLLSSGWVQALFNGAQSALSWLLDVIKQVPGVFWHAIGGGAPRGPESAPTNIAALTGAILPLVLGQSATALSAQFAVPWLTGVDRIIGGAVRSILSYEEIQGRWIRPAIDAFVGVPSAYYFNRVFQPRLPAAGELLGMVGEQHISREAFLDTILYHGLNADWGERLIELSYRPVPFFRLASMGQYAAIDDDFIVTQLKKGAYVPSAVAPILGYIKQTATIFGAEPHLGSLLGLHRLGWITDDQYAGELRGIGYGDEFIGAAVHGARWAWAYSYLNELAGTFSDAYKKDQIDEGEYRQQLATLGLNAERINAHVIRDRIAKTPRPAKPKAKPQLPRYQRPEGKTDLQTAELTYENGLSDRQAFVERLRDLEMPDELVIATVDLADARRAVAALRGVKPPTPAYESDAGRLQVRTLELLRLKDQIGDDALRAGLSALGMPEALVAATVANVTARRIEPEGPAELPIPKFVPNSPQAILFQNARIAFRRGDLSEDQLGDVLISLGYRPEDARAVIDAESLIRTVPLPEEPPLVPRFAPRSPQAILFADSRTAYRQGKLTEPELREILIFLGYEPEQADAIVEADSLLAKAVPVV